MSLFSLFLVYVNLFDYMVKKEFDYIKFIKWLKVLLNGTCIFQLSPHLPFSVTCIFQLSPYLPFSFSCSIVSNTLSQLLIKEYFVVAEIYIIPDKTLKTQIEKV